ERVADEPPGGGELPRDPERVQQDPRNSGEPLERKQREQYDVLALGAGLTTPFPRARRHASASSSRRLDGPGVTVETSQRASARAAARRSTRWRRTRTRDGAQPPGPGRRR